MNLHSKQCFTFSETHSQKLFSTYKKNMLWIQIKIHYKNKQILSFDKCHISRDIPQVISCKNLSAHSKVKKHKYMWLYKQHCCLIS